MILISESHTRVIKSGIHLGNAGLNDFRLQLLELIEQGNSGEAVRFASDKVLQSYKNGLKTGSLGARKTR